METRPAGFEKLVRGPAFLHPLETVGDAEHECGDRVTAAVAFGLLMPARGPSFAPRDHEPVFRSISGLHPI